MEKILNEYFPTFARTFFVVLMCEFGSASQFVLFANASHSKKIYTVWIAGTLALMFSSYFAVRLGQFAQNLPFSVNVLSGIIMVLVGLFFISRGVFR